MTRADHVMAPLPRVPRVSLDAGNPAPGTTAGEMAGNRNRVKCRGIENEPSFLKCGCLL